LTGTPSLTVSRGRLRVETGFGCLDTKKTEDFETPFPFKRVVFVGKGGVWSDQALRLLTEGGVALYQLSQTGETGYYILPGDEPMRASLVRLQARLPSLPLGLELARSFIAAKLEGQRETLSWLKGQASLPGLEPEAFARSAEFAAVEEAASVDHLRLVEARAADDYFAQWRGFPVSFARSANGCVEAPSHWRRWAGRGNGLAGNREATDPLNALLIFAYAIAAAEVMIACRAEGLEPSLGFLHADRDGRASLVYDLIEPLRPRVDRYALGLAAKRSFRMRRDFILLGKGVCRLGVELASEVAAAVSELCRPLAAAVATEVRRRLQAVLKIAAESSRRGIETDLEEPAFSWQQESPAATPEAPAERPEERASDAIREAEPSRPKSKRGGCVRCGGAVRNRSKLCDPCRFARRREVVLRNNERLWERRRADGDHSHGGEAAAKRSASLERSHALNPWSTKVEVTA
jgi:CRISPR-associated endonuclease Cas1